MVLAGFLLGVSTAVYSPNICLLVIGVQKISRSCKLLKVNVKLMSLAAIPEFNQTII